MSYKHWGVTVSVNSVKEWRGDREKQTEGNIFSSQSRFAPLQLTWIHCKPFSISQTESIMGDEAPQGYSLTLSVQSIICRWGNGIIPRMNGWLTSQRSGQYCTSVRGWPYYWLAHTLICCGSTVCDGPNMTGLLSLQGIQSVSNMITSHPETFD